MVTRRLTAFVGTPSYATGGEAALEEVDAVSSADVDPLGVDVSALDPQSSPAIPRSSTDVD